MKQKRLLSIVSFLNKKDNIIDVGCDHGYVAIESAKLGSKRVIATDIHESALKVAIKNIKNEGLDNIIQTKVTDGIEGIKLKDYNTIVIAGMGTSTIKHILENKDLSSIKKIILQSNNDLPELRIFMNSLKYKLVEEKVIYEKNHYYTIMKYVVGEDSLSEEEILFGLFNKSNLDYYKYIDENYLSVLKKIPWYKFNIRKEINKKRKILKKYL